MTSVIIPAYNEQSVIGRTLQSLLASIGDREAEIIVVCNACVDQTAKVARSIDRRVNVIETPTPGKCNAINLGEQHAKTFPRIYLDADITVSSTFFADMENVFSDSDVDAAWPSVRYDLSECSWAVKAFYKVWTTLPYNKPGRIGVGAYGLSEKGRKSFDNFPKIISDDGFVRGLFDQDKRLVSQSCHTNVLAPKTLDSLIAVRTRSRMGVYELSQKHPDMLSRHRERGPIRLSDYLSCLKPNVLLSMPVYTVAVLITKYQAKQRLRSKMSSEKWDRDLSQRTA